MVAIAVVQHLQRPRPPHAVAGGQTSQEAFNVLVQLVRRTSVVHVCLVGSKLLLLLLLCSTDHLMDLFVAHTRQCFVVYNFIVVVVVIERSMVTVARYNRLHIFLHLN